MNGGIVGSLPNERDLAPVGRPRRPGIFFAGSLVSRRTSEDPTRVRIRPSCPASSVPRERHLFAIRREGGIELPTRQRRERHRTHRCRRLRTAVQRQQQPCRCAHDHERSRNQRRDRSATGAHDRAQAPSRPTRLLLDILQRHLHVVDVLELPRGPCGDTGESLSRGRPGSPRRRRWRSGCARIAGTERVGGGRPGNARDPVTIS